MNRNLSNIVRYTGLLLLLIVLQILFGRLIAISGMVPDFVLIGVFVVAVRFGQIPATVAGFTAGLILDLYAGEVVGISALAKTVGGFTAGYFFEEEKADLLIRDPRFMLITFLCSLLHNVLYLLSYFTKVDFHILDLLLMHGFGAAVYTTVLSTIPVLLLSRMNRRIAIST